MPGKANSHVTVYSVHIQHSSTIRSRRDKASEAVDSAEKHVAPIYLAFSLRSPFTPCNSHSTTRRTRVARRANQFTIMHRVSHFYRAGDERARPMHRGPPIKVGWRVVYTERATVEHAAGFSVRGRYPRDVIGIFAR